jgi:hypothetical protein
VNSPNKEFSGFFSILVYFGFSCNVRDPKFHGDRDHLLLN